MHTTPSTNHPTQRPWVALESHNYRLLWLGFILANLGLQAQQVANLWQVYELTGSPLQLGLTGLFQALAILIFGLFGGVLADAFDRRQVMLVSQSLRLLVTLALGIVTQLGIAEVWHVYAATFLVTALGILDRPARQAVIANAVPRSHLFSAVSLQISSVQASRLIGPSLAGIAISTLGLTFTYYAITATVLLVIALVLALQYAQTQERGNTSFSLSAMLEGFKFIWAAPVIMGLIALDFGMTFFGAYRPLLPIFAEEVLRVGPAGLGALFAAPGVGALLGSGAVVLLGDRRFKTALALAGTAVYAFCLAPLGLSHLFLLSLVLTGGLGFFDSMAATIRQTTVQLAAPDALRGRVTSVHQMFSQSGPNLGYVQVGVTASLFGVGTALVIGAALCLATVVVVGIWWRRAGVRLVASE